MSENQEQTEQQKQPSKEEVVAFFQEQIEVKKVQLELQQLNAQLAVAKAEELKALAFIAQITSPPSQEEEEEEEPAKARTLKKDK